MKEKGLKPYLDTPPETVACVLPSTGDTARGAAREMRGGKGDLDGQLTCNGTRRFRPWAFSVAVFLRRSRPSFSMHKRRHIAVRVKFGC